MFSSRYLLILKIFVSFFFIAYLFYKHDISNLRYYILNFTLFIYIFFFTFFAYFLIALRLKILCELKKINISFFQVFRINTITSLFSIFIPPSLTDLVRVYFLKRVSNIYDSIIVVSNDRIYGFLAKCLLILFSATCFVLIYKLEFIEFLFFFYLFFFLTIIIFLKKKNIFKIKIKFILNFFFKNKKLKILILGIFSLSNKKITLKVCTLSLLIQIIDILSYYLISKESNNDILFTDLLIIIPISSLLSSLPINYNRWGVREFLIIFFGSIIGIPEETSFELAIFRNLIEIIITFIFIPIFIYDFKKIKH